MSLSATALNPKRRNDLLRTFEEALRRSRVSATPVLAAVSFEIDAIDPLMQFRAWRDSRTCCRYWESRAPALAMVGWGSCLDLCGSDTQRFTDIGSTWRTLLATAVVHGPLPACMIGGFGFDPERPPQRQWRHYPAARMSVPRLVLRCDENGCRLLCQHLARRDDDAVELVERYSAYIDTLRPSANAPTATAALAEIDALPSLEWQALVEQAIQRIRAGQMFKVVLAREVRHRYSRTLNPADMLERARNTCSNAHIFAISHHDSCFLGATPERLALVHGGLLKTHALAGSARRGATSEEDQTLGTALLNSAKDRHEHALVVDAIRTILSSRVESLDIAPEPLLHKLANIQHLSTPIQARLRNNIGLLDVIGALHPTPAVAGLARDAAMHHIRQHEGFDRGWYAGPIGWMDGNGDGDFVVALRSALVDGADCYLYAGCGIVAESLPALEYQETCIKLTPMQSVLSDITAGSRCAAG